MSVVIKCMWYQKKGYAVILTRGVGPDLDPVPDSFTWIQIRIRIENLDPVILYSTL
jgi:hypothetical protein